MTEAHTTGRGRMCMSRVSAGVAQKIAQTVPPRRRGGRGATGAGGAQRIWVTLSGGGGGDVEFLRDGGLSGFADDCVEERARLLMVASWSARTSSRRTSESDMRRDESLGSRISMNLEGVSRIV